MESTPCSFLDNHQGNSPFSCGINNAYFYLFTDLKSLRFRAVMSAGHTMITYIIYTNFMSKISTDVSRQHPKPLSFNYLSHYHEIRHQPGCASRGRADYSADSLALKELDKLYHLS